MSAAEIIALIERLPPAERAEVAAYVKREYAGTVDEAPAGYSGPVEAAERKIRYISNEDFEKAVPRIFEKHRELFRRLAQ